MYRITRSGSGHIVLLPFYKILLYCVFSGGFYMQLNEG